MKEGDQIVCVDNRGMAELKFGTVYTLQEISTVRSGEQYISLVGGTLNPGDERLSPRYRIGRFVLADSPEGVQALLRGVSDESG